MARRGARLAAIMTDGRRPGHPEGKARLSRGAIIPFLVGAVSAGGAAVLLGLLYVAVGGFNVSAAIPHRPLAYWITKTMMTRSVKLRAQGVVAPATFSQAQVLAGFRIYDARCVGCHGAPNIGARDPGAQGMTPIPPYLVAASRDWSPPELYWIIRNGVKLTGMPAWDRECTDPEIWQLVAFLEALPRMNSTAYRDLRAAASASPAGSAANGCSGTQHGGPPAPRGQGAEE